MRIPVALGCAAFAALVTASAPASAAVRVGVLRCNVAGGLGLIITSSKQMSCVFRSKRGYSERYDGTIRKFGLDIGKTDRGVLVWGVFAPSSGRTRGALAGNYVGVAASATVGVGGGANALVGGFNRSFTLQPFSGQAQSGLALAAGVASMDLTAGH
jgi:Protein of unknown function (DUF992)